MPTIVDRAATAIRNATNIHQIPPWAPPPVGLGELLGDEIWRICLDRGIEPIALDRDEQGRLMRVIHCWEAVNGG